ncbi:MAG: 50S ribosomal protein L19e [Candidatus Pacearchaeota archaeon]
MNLGKKKELAKRTFNVGKERIVFVEDRLGEIKEHITKQDMRDLKKDGAIIIKDVKGRAKAKKKRKKSTGNIRKKVNKRKEEYMATTRKLRKYISELKRQGKISREDVTEIRKKIRNRAFKSKAHLKTHIGELKK